MTVAPEAQERQVRGAELGERAPVALDLGGRIGSAAVEAVEARCQAERCDQVRAAEGLEAARIAGRYPAQLVQLEELRAREVERPRACAAHELGVERHRRGSGREQQYGRRLRAQRLGHEVGRAHGHGLGVGQALELHRGEEDTRRRRRLQVFLARDRRSARLARYGRAFALCPRNPVAPMPRLLVALALLLAPRIAQAEPQADDAARIVPAEAAVLVRLESARALDELVHAFAPITGADAARFELQVWLDSLASDEQAPDARPRLDPERPLYFALTLDPAGGPSWTVAAPVVNGQPFQLHATFGASTSQVVGSYAALTSRPVFEASTAASALFAGLHPGLVSVRIDLAKLIATFRPLIEMGLAQAEGALDQLPAGDMPFDVQPLLEVYLEGARALLDSARTLDLALERRGERLTLAGTFTEEAERLGEVAQADVGPLLGLLDPASPVQFAFNGKWTDSLVLVEDFVDAAFQVYPEPLRTDMQRLFAQQRALDPLLAPGAVASFDLGPAGMRAGYFLRTREPEQLMSALEALMRTLDHEGGLVRIGAAERLLVDGLEARVLPAEIRYEALQSLLTQASPDGAVGEPEKLHELQKLREGLQAIYGERMRMALAARGDLVAVCVAPNDSELRAALARLAAPALPDARLVALAERIEPGALGLAYQLDFGRFAGRLADAMQVLVPEALLFPDLDASLGFFGSLRGGTWSGGMTLSLAELAEFARAVGALRGR